LGGVVWGRGKDASCGAVLVINRSSAGPGCAWKRAMAEMEKSRGMDLCWGVNPVGFPFVKPSEGFCGGWLENWVVWNWGGA